MLGKHMYYFCILESAVEVVPMLPYRPCMKRSQTNFHL